MVVTTDIDTDVTHSTENVKQPRTTRPKFSYEGILCSSSKREKSEEPCPFIIITIFNTGSYFCYFIFYYRLSSIFMKSKSTS